MKIVVFGAGAIGSLFGAFLSKDNEVTLVGREEHMLAVRKNGLRITGKTEMKATPRSSASAAECGKPDILFLMVKAYDTAKAVEEAKSLIGPGTVVVGLQNGLGNLEIIREKLADAKIVGGITSHGAILTAPGIIEHTGIGDSTVGIFGDAPAVDNVDSDPATRTAHLLNAAGIETTVNKNIIEDVWYKALVNCAINPLATLSGSTNDVLLRDPALQRLAKDVVSEGVMVAAAQGVKLSEEEAYLRVMKVASQTAENTNSMLQDMMRGKRTEIEQLNGAIARMGAAAGIRTPVNVGLMTQIEGFEALSK